jgi:succinate dehydrogenase / fumarate reductase cytochrome b subunit
MSTILPSASRRGRVQFRNIHVSQILAYRLPPPGLVSIFHRISGAAMFLLLPLVLWLFELSLTSEGTFGRLKAFVGHPLAKLVLAGLLWALLHHMVAGIRFLLLDLHMGITRDAARKSALAVFAISLPLTLVAVFFLFRGA